MREARFDVVIAGAGPAGSSTALRLARAGFAVALVEARRLPRFKPCGEFMSPECLPLLRELDVYESVCDLGARRVRGMLLHGHGRRALGRFVDVGAARAPFDHGFAVRRERFDEVLLRGAQRAGATLFEDARVTELVRDADGAVAGLRARSKSGEALEVRARWTIGADGVRSRVAEELGVRRELPWLRKLALTTRYRGVEWGENAEVHFFDGGYFACSPVDDGLLSLNLVLDLELFEREGLPRDEALGTWLARIPALGERVARGERVDPVRGIGPLATTTSAQTFDGAALVGDACGYVDPVTGEGIFFALEGGSLLAESVGRALHAHRNDRAALRDYLQGRRREIAPRVAMSRLLQRGLKHPRLVRGALSLLQARPALADLLVSVTGDYVPVRELARPSNWMRLVASNGGAA